MKLVTYRESVEAEARLGVIAGDMVVDVAALADAYGEELPDTMLGLIDWGEPALAALRDLLAEAGDTPPPGTATRFENVRLLAPIPRPRKNIFGIGLNYVNTSQRARQHWTQTPTCQSNRWSFQSRPRR